MQVGRGTSPAPNSGPPREGHLAGPRPDGATPGADAAVLDELMAGLQAAARSIVPGFLATMPRAYFEETDQATMLGHIKAIIASEASGVSQAMTVVDEAGNRFAVISDRSFPGQLGELVGGLPTDRPLRSARAHTAVDGSRVVDVFEFGSAAPPDPADAAHCERLDAIVEHARTQAPDVPADRLRAHLRSCSWRYLRTVPVAQVFQHYRAVEGVRASGRASVEIGDPARAGEVSVVLVVGRSEGRRLFESVCRHLGRSGIDIRDAHVDVLEDSSRDVVCLMRLTLGMAAGTAPAGSGATWRWLEDELLRLVHVDDEVVRATHQSGGRSLLEAEVLVALGHLAHQILVVDDPLAFARDRIVDTALRHPALAHAIADGFLERFRPGSQRSPDPTERLAERIGTEVDRQDEQLILSTLLAVVDASLRSNVHDPGRSALCLRLDPSLLAAPGRDEAPFGVFFVHGRGFDGFHVRFRDIARGGLRLVQPRSAEQHALEGERLYTEAYGLALAQQLKNKDIPEGGAKAVVLARPGVDLERVGRSFADALLDLVLPGSEASRRDVDHYGRPEQLYLGPDENVSTALITWIVDRAEGRGHPAPGVFMSSKPGAGINHKEYGVTSEGVTVFLAAALRARGIDPRSTPFSVTLTGGPDGDVAGNEIRILHRDYGPHARIVGIADASGALEDPDGLDHAELLRLVGQGLPVSAFDPARLGPGGRLLTTEDPGGLQARNSMHNRLSADAFIPAGGRPGTINASNWSQFLRPDGRPASPIIVEGANLFLTPEARLRLSENGVLIVKDSSANKCGVICSSYEIVAGMLLDEQGFLEIKDAYVAEVLARLRHLAGLEAGSLFRERAHRPEVPLPELSTRLSRVIIRTTDAVTSVLDTLPAEDAPLTRRLVRAHLPPVLLDRLGEALFDRIPAPYLAQLVASTLASRIVYREGLDWLEHMPPDAVAEVAMRYLREDDRVDRLARTVESSDLPDRMLIADLLREGGPGAALRRGPTD